MGDQPVPKVWLLKSTRSVLMKEILTKSMRGLADFVVRVIDGAK